MAQAKQTNNSRGAPCPQQRETDQFLTEVNSGSKTDSQTICYRQYGKPTVSPLDRIAELAPVLKEAELRVLLQLMADTQDLPEPVIRISSRALSRKTKVGRAAIQRALDSLTARRYITVREGTSTAAAAYLVNVFATTSMGGLLKRPPPHSKEATPGLSTEPQVAPERGHPGLFQEPPPTENKRPCEADSAVDIDYDSIDHRSTTIPPNETELIGRVLRAKPQDFTPQELAGSLSWIFGYQAKKGPYNRAKGEVPHVPDDKVLARIITAAAPWTAEVLIHELMKDGTKAGEKYEWYVTVALQRVHGIQPQALAARRAELRAISGGKTFARDLTQALTLGVKRVP